MIIFGPECRRCNGEDCVCCEVYHDSTTASTAYADDYDIFYEDDNE